MKISEKTCVEFVNLLASKSAVPGGGGAAALVGAIGMALGSMVCNLTIGKKKYAEYEDSVKEILVKAGEIEEKLLSMIDEDANNFLPLSKAYGLPTSTEEEKKIKEETMENALKVVKYLENHPQVEKVHHPSVSDDEEQKRLYAKYFPNGGGSIFTFEIKGDDRKAKDFIDNLELFSLLANVADVKSLVIHPASTTHAQLNEEELADQGIKPNTIRLSIGTENIDDIIEDLDEAFKAVEE